MKKEKKIAFCITCMNRLEHIQQTLVQNIEDNFLPEKVEFILLDYNSSDRLDEWVKSLQRYIDSGILKYYRIESPERYHRSHSRNIAFRLANAEIVCNLDADNFLGKGFAEYVIERFTNAKEPMFITSALNARDVFGRFCSLRSDFLQINGYNELLAGYGAEDTDLFKRLCDLGLKQEVLENNDFYKVVKHSNNARVTNEHYWRTLRAFYVAYETPYRNSFILLKDDFTCEYGQLINNPIVYMNAIKQYANPVEYNHDQKNRVVLDDLKNTIWSEVGNILNLRLYGENLQFHLFDETITVGGRTYYKISNNETLSMFIVELSTAVNFDEAQKIIASGLSVNPNGFGQGIIDIFDK